MPERLTKKSPITLVEPAPTASGRLDNLLMVDTYTGIDLPTRGAELLQAILTDKGWTNVNVINPRYNDTPGIFNENDWRRMIASPILGISLITRTAPQAAELAHRYKAANPQGTVIAGGAHATFAVEGCLEWADIIVRKEGDVTLPELLNALVDSGTVKGVQGVSYKDGGQIVNEPDRPLLTEKELGELPWPEFDPRFRRGRVHASTVIASRGCPHACSFCSVTQMNGECYRRAENDCIVPRVEEIYHTEPSDRIFHADDNFAGKPKLAEELLQEFIDKKLNDPRHMMQLHASIGLRKGFSDLARKAGVFLVALGIESMNDVSLSSLGKDSLSVKVNIEGVRAFREAGVPILGMFINGVDGDTKETLRAQLEWAKRNVDIAQFFAPGPLPGTPFAQQMEEEGRVLTHEYCLYDGQNVIIRPKEISPYDLQMLIREMNEDFFTYKLDKGRKPLSDSRLDTIIRLYARNLLRNTRRYFDHPQTQQHLQNLKAWS